MRWTAAVAVTCVAMGLACGGGKNEAETTATTPPAPTTTAPPPAPTPPPEPPKPVVLTYADTSFQCCDNGTAAGILDNYLDYLGKLEAGGAGKGELTALEGYAKKCQDVLGAEDKRTCTNIEALCDEMRKSESAGRAKLPELGMRVMEIVKRHKGSGKQTVAIAHCDKNDAYWIQRTEVLKSPFGGANADCGTYIKLDVGRTVGEAFIIDVLRTPVGRKKGALSGIRADDLAAIPMKALVERSGIDPAAIDDVVLGCVTQVGEQGLNVARNAALLAGFPVEVTGTSVNRMCGSSQQALNFAAMGVASGHQDLVVAGGVESMTRVPMSSDMYLNGEMVPPSPALSWRFTIVPQGISAELVAKRFELRRDEIDAYSLESHRRAGAADDAGRFAKEIIPVPVRAADGQDVVFAHDEGIRRDTTIEKLRSLKPAFDENGVITAGSSSQISDGASMVLVASERAVKEHGLRPRARIVAMATVGVDPTIMLTGPIPATRKALARAGLSIGDLDAIEINEAFASVALGCGRALELDFDKTNVFGGAIALGHPLGASGTRLVATLLSVLDERKGRYGLATMCIGFGQGIATIVERL